MMIKNGDPIQCPDGTWCVWGGGLPLLWGSSQQAILSEVSLRLGSHTLAVEEMACGARRWTQLAEQAPAVHRMLTKKLKPISCASPASIEAVLIPERASAAPQLTARQQRYQAAQADEARRDARRAEHHEQLRRERKAAALELAAEGKTQREISADLGLNRALVANLIPGATKVAQARVAPKVKPPSAKDRVKAIATVDTTPEHVAEQAGTSLRFAQNVMARMGVWVAPSLAPHVDKGEPSQRVTPRMQRKAERWGKIEELAKAGQRPTQIAAVIGATAEHVRHVLRTVGFVLPKTRATQRASVVESERIIAAYRDNGTIETVATALGIGQHAVMKVLRAAGEMRPKGYRRPGADKGGRRPLLNEAQHAEMAALWRQGGVTHEELAKKYGVGRTTVALVLQRHGAMTRAAQRHEWDDQALALYQQGLTLDQVADKIGGTRSRVHSAIRRLGHTAESARVESVKDAELLDTYKQLRNVRRTAYAHRIPVSVARERLCALGVEARRARVPEEVTAEIVRRYEAGESMPKIAAALGCAVSTVYQRLRREGVKLRSGERVGTGASKQTRAA